MNPSDESPANELREVFASVDRKLTALLRIEAVIAGLLALLGVVGAIIAAALLRRRDG